MKITPAYFEFTKYYFKPEINELLFSYKIEFENKEPLIFTEKIVLPSSLSIRNVPAKLLDNVLQDLHLMLGISYFKLYFPPAIKLSHALSQKQADFWNLVYRKGLGEFMYRNNIDPDTLALFPYDGDVNRKPLDLPPGDKALVGIGGGKDSIVAIELLKEQSIDMTAFTVETQQDSKVAADIIREAGLEELKIKRYLDKKIFENHPDSLNGHIPISAIFAWLGLFSAIVYGYRYVVVANEYSSNFGNLKYGKEVINHQWSKSAEFENLFQDYVRRYVTGDVTYFSPVRPFYEIRIVEMFSRYKNYFPYFTSCNRSFRIHKERPKELWCGKCPKCAFMFALLAAFLSKEEVVNIFGKNLYEDQSLLPVYNDLLGFGDLKPFDCVGTFEEVKAALYLAREKFEGSLITQTYLPRITNGDEIVSQVFQTNVSPTVPPKFRFLGMKKVLILGYGREGKITEEYLKEKYPQLEIGIADASSDDQYLERQHSYDLAIKTPGISKKNVSIQYTTATNIFFSQVKNVIIGVTGSKGKSTTASLIHAMITASGRKATLLGNIGKPMLSALLRPIDEEEVFVLELSSYQLDDIRYSPHIAVVLNLFPDHMDYHGGLDEYYNAKKNMVLFQRNEDYFVYNEKNEIIKEWARESPAQAIAFNKEGDTKTFLMGSHNQDNIRAAKVAARLCGVDDDSIEEAVHNFTSLPHRLEKVGEFKGVTFYDDAISTTPESTVIAIESIPNIGTIMLGGQDRGYDFTGLVKAIKEHGIKNIVLFPDSGFRIFEDTKDFNVLKTDSMEEAVRFAYEHTLSGQVCLLSTASPSYSVWKDFEAKGNEFQAMVKKMG